MRLPFALRTWLVERALEVSFAAGIIRRSQPMDAPTLHMPVREPWFSAMQSRRKVFEGRLNRPPYSKLRPGALKFGDKFVLKPLACHMPQSFTFPRRSDHCLPEVGCRAAHVRT